MVEEWRPVAGYEDRYEVSNLGQVRSLRRSGRLLATPPRSPKAPYPSISLWDGEERPRANVHVLVAEAFLGPRPPGMQVCHNDGNRANCAVSNLRYDTPAANSADSAKHGTRPQGERHFRSRLTDEMVREIRWLASLGVGCAVIGERFGLDKSTAWSVMKGRSWKHVKPDIRTVIIEVPED